MSPAMVGAARVVPKWETLKSQLSQKLQPPKEVPDAVPGKPMLVSDRPTSLFRASCHPHRTSDICFYPAGSTNMFVCFSWGSSRAREAQARLWQQSVQDERLVLEKDIPMDEQIKVLLVSHVPSLGLLATYCDDLHLRLFGDHSQGLQLLAAFRCPHSVTSMCYNPDTGELVTGGIGCLVFWSLCPGTPPGLAVVWSTQVANAEFVQSLSVEREAGALVAMCENTIRLYDYQRRAETRALQVSQGPSLTCCSAHWPQGHLYVGDTAGQIQLWSLATGRQELQFQAHLSAVTSVVCRLATHTLLTASLDGLLKEWGLGTSEPLRQLAMGEPLLQLHFISEGAFYCRSQHSFSIHTLRNCYQLFSAAGAGLRRLARVPCGPGRARILAAAQDGTFHFLSPVTGELLCRTWPFRLLEKALDYVYDPEREELLVTVGTADVYVLDTSTCPSPPKCIVQPTENREDKVLSLAVVRLGLGPLPWSFVFSGHKSGHVRLLSPHAHCVAEWKIHQGGVRTLCTQAAGADLSYQAAETSVLCSYGADERIVLSCVGLKGSELQLLPTVVLSSTSCRLQSLLLLPDYVCALTVENQLQLWRLATLGLCANNPPWLETDPLHACTITSWDYCHPLRLLLTCGADGSLRLWDMKGSLLVDFDTSLKFSQACFANPRGDLLASCGPNIYLISCLQCLPRGHLQALAACQLGDDAVEEPLPFLPNFLLCFDTLFVPRYLQAGAKTKHYQGMEALTSHRELVPSRSVARVVASAKTGMGASPSCEAPTKVPRPPAGFPPARASVRRRRPAFMELPSSEEAQVPRKPVVLLKPFLPGGTLPIRPDGYIPNSVVRAQLWPLGTPHYLQCSFQTSPRQQLPRQKPAPARWGQQQEKAVLQPRDQPPGEVALAQELLAQLAAKDWLRLKPGKVTLESVTRAILAQLDKAQPAGYSLRTAALVQLSQAFVLPAPLQAEAAARLLQGTASENSQVRLMAWQTLGAMGLLSCRDLVPLAWALLDQDRQVQDKARSLIASVTAITHKRTLQMELRNQATPGNEQSPRTVTVSGLVPPGPEAEEVEWAPVLVSVAELEHLLGQVETRLTDELYLLQECPKPQARSRVPGPQWPKGAELLEEEEEVGSAEARGQAKQPQIFEQTQLPRSSVTAKDAPGKRKQSHSQDKLPKIQPGARPPMTPVVVPSGEGLGCGSMLKRQKGPGSLPSKEPTVKLPQVGRPAGGPRQDTTTRRYQETLKRQVLQRRRPGEAVPSEPRQPSARATAPAPSDAFLINPNQRYGAESWRDDLCKLLNLRTAPLADNRGTLAELLASARLVLDQQSSSSGPDASSGTFFSDLQKTSSSAMGLAASLAQEAWAREAERIVTQGAPADRGLARGAPEKGGLAWGGPAEGSLARGAPVDRGLARGAPVDGVLAQGVPEEEGLAWGAPADGGLAQGAPAEGGLAWGTPADGGLALGAEQVLGSRECQASGAREAGLARDSLGAEAAGLEGQVWQRIRPLLETLADPAKLQQADTAELLGQLQALGQSPSTQHRVALQSMLAMASQVLGEEDAGLGTAVSLCALLACPRQQLPPVTVTMKLRQLLQAQPCPEASWARELLGLAQTRLQASAEKMAQEWAWWEQGAQAGQPSLQPEAPRGDKKAGLGTQPPPACLPPRGRLPRRGTRAGRRQEAAPQDKPREKVDLYLPDRLPGAPWPKRRAAQQPSKDKMLALYQVLLSLQQRHGHACPAWWEQFHRLVRLYSLQQPLGRAFVRHLGAAAQQASKPSPGRAKALKTVGGLGEDALGQRILCQVLPRAPRQPPTFCFIIPLSYQNNVHVLQPCGQAHYGALALAWRTAGRARQGQQPQLHLGVG